MKPHLPPSGVVSRAASIWTAGARVRASLYRAGLLRQRSLRASVISIGNISWGGTGKTPFTIWLARRLQAVGLRVSILTRGYGRTSGERVKIHAPGAAPQSAREDGDEVQLYLRHLNLPVGISSSRYEAGKLLEDNFSVDVHLLDDGFQHLTIARNLDIVLIDAANPWGSRRGLPVFLREGFSSLRRADLVLLTRCELASETATSSAAIESLKATVDSYNQDIPIYLVRTELIRFVDFQTGKPLRVEECRTRHPLAFCALGNPQNFFRMLEHASINAVAKKVFRDHHGYEVNDLRMLAAEALERRADCFITTEKDSVNFPSNVNMALPLYWAEIEQMVEKEERVMSWILDQLPLSPAVGCRSSHSDS